MAEPSPIDAGEFDADSVAAIIYTPDGDYVMQLRDDLPAVTFRGMLGLFGGSRDPGEDFEAALRRELREELCADPAQVREFMVMTFDRRMAGGRYARRRFYMAEASREEIAHYKLGEGAAIELMSFREIVAKAGAIIPYDFCAISLHAQDLG
jgi:8-oxo-dGTP pyrophosphatase MutT (NUDIX family)